MKVKGKADGFCGICGEEVLPTNLNLFYCSETCRMEAWVRHHPNEPKPRGYMKTWHLRPRDLESWDFLSFGSIVVAPTEERARKTAAEASEDVWLDSNLTLCEELIADEFDVDCLILDNVDIPLLLLLKNRIRRFFNV